MELKDGIGKEFHNLARSQHSFLVNHIDVAVKEAVKVRDKRNRELLKSDLSEIEEASAEDSKLNGGLESRMKRLEVICAEYE